MCLETQRIVNPRGLLALVLVVASVSSVNLALAEISLDLGTTSSQLTWIADGYTVALAALVTLSPALGAVLMSLSAIVVALNAQVLRRVRLTSPECGSLEV